MKPFQVVLLFAHPVNRLTQLTVHDVDATMVSMMPVPALMRLLGARSWWTPKRINRIMPPQNHYELKDLGHTAEHGTQADERVSEIRRVIAANESRSSNHRLPSPVSDAERIWSRRPTPQAETKTTAPAKPICR